MCDTLIAAGEVTKDKFAIFAKNSDRPPNEAQYLEWLSPQIHSAGEKVQCTYLNIPQVKETNAVLLSKPVWVDAPPEKKPVPTSQYDAKTLFWSHERLHREVIRNYQDRLITYQ
ncbi:MAG: hypothetical protein MUO54_07570, partial [Anaerolineales bacterium]|nr:hypothetical protein [Anaerolineales bacterium]